MFKIFLFVKKKKRKEKMDILHLNDFTLHFNLNFHLALENIDNRALNTFAVYDHNNPIKRKRPKTGVLL